MSAASEDPRDVYWNGLEGGRLRYQRCTACANKWLPPRTECPRCWSAQWVWEEASGEGRVVSWVVFHTAFHEAFRERVPYNVAVVELAEGPRLVTNLIEPLEEGDLVDRRCILAIERDHDRALPRFRLA
jgi:uncharacterized OB-fold protein